MRLTKEDVLAQRELILKSAFTVFTSKGYAATKMEDIAQEAGLSRSPLYYHYKNKIQLFTSVFEAFIENYLEGVRKCLGQDLNIFEKLEQELLSCIGGFGLNGNRLFTDIYGDVPEMAGLKKLLRDYNEKIYEAKIVAINCAITCGEIKPETDPRLIADIIFVIAGGFTSESNKQFIEGDSQKIKTLTSSVINGMRALYST